METILLRDQQTPPTAEVLSESLGPVYSVYEAMLEAVTSADFDLVVEWNYYKDGKAWLCKVSFKKKTIFWLSVWDKHFKVSFYFTEKTKGEIETQDISDQIKKDFGQSKSIGKLIPLTLMIESEEQLPDLLKIVACKKRLK
ncbi:MAG: DUF3788 domain-containing protein [Bacteroidetes bacterium]|nr:DUF3788 domain-containing protein [Bacteroidota bacterium]